MQRQPKCLLTDEENVIHTYNGIYICSLKEGNFAICDNLDESWGCYTKWNKRDTENNYYMIPVKWNIKKS